MCAHRMQLSVLASRGVDEKCRYNTHDKHTYSPLRLLVTRHRWMISLRCTGGQRGAQHASMCQSNLCVGNLPHELVGSMRGTMMTIQRRSEPPPDPEVGAVAQYRAWRG